jgi:hypothetical protein
MLRWLTLLVCCCSTAASASQFFDPLDGQFDVSEYLAENAYGFLPVPIIITEPAVDAGLGLVGLFFHESDEAAEKRRKAMASGDNAAAHLLPPNVSAVAAAYTGNGSWFAGGGHMGFFNEGRIRYRGGAGIASVDLDYYSLGGRPLPRPLGINTEALFVMQTLKFRLGESDFYLGPLQRYTKADLSLNSELFEALPPELGDPLEDFLSTDTALSALGLELEYDGRDNVFTPTRGLYYNFDYGAYRDGLGSDVEYDWYKLTGLHYLPLNAHWRAGLRVEAELVDTDSQLPPFALPGIKLRGVPSARYQGKRVLVSEFEMTWQATPRWSVLGFVGAGKAVASSSDFGAASSRVSKGLGFRYQIARRYGFHMGIDVARGPEDTVWYIQAGSAW